MTTTKEQMSLDRDLKAIDTVIDNYSKTLKLSEEDTNKLIDRYGPVAYDIALKALMKPQKLLDALPIDASQKEAGALSRTVIRHFLDNEEPFTPEQLSAILGTPTAQIQKKLDRFQQYSAEQIAVDEAILNNENLSAFETIDFDMPKDEPEKIIKINEKVVDEIPDPNKETVKVDEKGNTLHFKGGYLDYMVDPNGVETHYIKGVTELNKDNKYFIDYTKDGAYEEHFKKGKLDYKVYSNAIEYFDGSSSSRKTKTTYLTGPDKGKTFHYDYDGETIKAIEENGVKTLYNEQGEVTGRKYPNGLERDAHEEYGYVVETGAFSTVEWTSKWTYHRRYYEVRMDENGMPVPVSSIDYKHNKTYYAEDGKTPTHMVDKKGNATYYAEDGKTVDYTIDKNGKITYYTPDGKKDKARTNAVRKLQKAENLSPEEAVKREKATHSNTDKQTVISEQEAKQKASEAKKDIDNKNTKDTPLVTENKERPSEKRIERAINTPQTRDTGR